MLSRIEYIALFMVVLMLIAISEGGEGPLRELLADQLRNRETGPTIDEERIEARVDAWFKFSRFLGGTVANLALGQLEDGHEAMVSAVVMGVALVVFMSGYCHYHKQPTGQTPLGTFLRVFRNAFSKRHLPYPTNPNAFYKNDTNQLPLMPICILLSRWLDKAAIIENLPLNPEEQENRKKLCQVEEVIEVKLVLRMVPMWAAFFIYSFIEVTGNTFFFGQASNLDDHLAKNIIVPISFFYFINRWTSYGFTFLSGFIISKHWSAARKLLVAKIRIGLGMACGCLACFAAWQLEVKRLKNLKEFVNVTEDTVIDDMSIFLLTPQFFLLGLMEALAEDGLNDFLYLQVGEMMATYGGKFNEFAMGIGKFASIVWLLSFKFLFEANINNSRLDKYYRALVIAGVVNLVVVYGYVSIFFYKDAMGEKFVNRLDNVDIQLEENHQQVEIEGEGSKCSIRVICLLVALVISSSAYYVL